MKFTTTLFFFFSTFLLNANITDTSNHIIVNKNNLPLNDEVKISCEDLSNWIQSAMNQYPNTRGIKYSYGSNYAKRVYGDRDSFIANLYSDKFFIPFYGKRFEDLTERERSRLYARYNKCFSKLPKETHIVSAPLNRTSDYNETIENIKKLRQIRKKAKQFESFFNFDSQIPNASFDIENSIVKEFMRLDILSLTNNEFSRLYKANRYIQEFKENKSLSVSYTHLTLPTNREV